MPDFDGVTDALYEALLDMDDVIDPDLAATLTTGTIDVQMVVEAEDDLDAAAKAACLLRTAIHQLGGYTPGWEKAIRGVTASTCSAEMAHI